MEIEGIDRLYLNLYVPRLQAEAGCAHFLKNHLGFPQPSSVQMAPITRGFIRSIENFAKQDGVEIIQFKKGKRKHRVAEKYFQKFEKEEGVVVIGKAQEKARVVRTSQRHNPESGKTYPHLYYTTSWVNHYYFYCLDRDFGPFCLKLCSYFPYNGRVSLNGHEYLKRQLSQRGIGFEALENGLLSCDDPEQAQQICDHLDENKIHRLIRKWLYRLPHPFTRKDQKAGYTHDISILQSEFSLTQVLDRPVDGRIFFEQLIRDNIDLGRPDRVQLIFHRRITRKTPSQFRTRVVTYGVTPSLHIDYKHSNIKQYHKGGRALRTETTINDAKDFSIGKRLKNLSALRKVGFQANRRLLNVQQISPDASIGEDAFQNLQRPVVNRQNQKASALRFGDPRVLALLTALLLFRLLPEGFANRNLRNHMSELMGQEMTLGKITYDLRRLRVHGLIEKIPHSHRYRVTDKGFRVALFLNRSYTRLLKPGCSVLLNFKNSSGVQLEKAFRSCEKEIDKIWKRQSVAA
jgi:hypothetical protein